MRDGELGLGGGQTQKGLKSFRDRKSLFRGVPVRELREGPTVHLWPWQVTTVRLSGTKTS